MFSLLSLLESSPPHLCPSCFAVRAERCRLGRAGLWPGDAAADAAAGALVEGFPLPSLTEKSWRGIGVLYNEKKELGAWSDPSC